MFLAVLHAIKKGREHSSCEGWKESWCDAAHQELHLSSPGDRKTFLIEEKEGFSSTDLLFRASRGTGAQTPCQARSSGQQQDQAAGSQVATQPCLPFAKASLRRTVLKPTFFLSSEPAQPLLGRLPPPHPTPSKLPRRKAAERHRRVFRGRGRRRAVPAPG